MEVARAITGIGRRAKGFRAEVFGTIGKQGRHSTPPYSRQLSCIRLRLWSEPGTKQLAKSGTGADRDESGMAIRKSGVTSLDVAKRVGVSQSAVSRTFAKGPTQSSVSPATRAKILQAAGELGYRPNALARSLITQKSRMVALLFSYLDNQFYALALEKFCLALQEEGYHALVFMMPDTVKKAQETGGESSAGSRRHSCLRT